MSEKETTHVMENVHGARLWIMTVALSLLVVVLSTAGCKPKESQPAAMDKSAQLFPAGTDSAPMKQTTQGESSRAIVANGAAKAEATTPMKKPAAQKKTYAPPTEKEIKAAKAAGTRTATIKTTKGDIVIQLYGADAPLTVANFVKLTNANFYDGLTFHRVETKSDFSLIQGGDPMGDGTGDPGYSINLEISPKLRHVAGAVAMARSADPNSAGCQFYITTVPIPFLDDQYTVFGKVIKGLDVVKKITVGDAMKAIVLQ